MLMRQGLEKSLQALGSRCLSTSSAALQTAPAVAAIKSKGFFAQLFGGGQRVNVPLTDALPGVQLIEPVAPPTTAPTTETTTLSNGLRVASENTPGATATLGIYVDSGSVYETPVNTGASHLLEYLAFKTTKHRTHLRLVREVEVIGGNVLASASREQMAYNIDTSKVTVPEALEVLADAVLNPKFQSWEVAEQIKKMEGDIKNLKDNPQTTLLEGMHSVAYHGGLGRPLICPEGCLANLNAEVLAEFYAENYTAPRIVLAAAGVEHSQLVKLAEPLLSAAPSQGAGGEPASEYVGGDWRLFSASPLTHAILAFEYQGGWRDVKGSVAMTVLQYLLGGGGSFSAGGPGKGMHSRLYTRVLNQYPWMHNCTAINSIYNSSGLVGIFASAESSYAEEMVSVLCKELQAVAADVPAGEVERAKAAAISSVLMNLESRAVVAEDIGRQVLTYGHRKPVSEFIDEIRAVKPSDISAAVGKLLKTPPTLAALGDIANIPRYDLVAKRFG
ncbi:hypothetical protein N2152v2_008997 [Parachlorella kessleri]